MEDQQHPEYHPYNPSDNFVKVVFIIGACLLGLAFITVKNGYRFAFNKDKILFGPANGGKQQEINLSDVLTRIKQTNDSWEIRLQEDKFEHKKDEISITEMQLFIGDILLSAKITGKHRKRWVNELVRSSEIAKTLYQRENN